jgi:hypothetical protein
LETRVSMSKVTDNQIELLEKIKPALADILADFTCSQLEKCLDKNFSYSFYEIRADAFDHIEDWSKKLQEKQKIQ